jgi:hypothetical protein
MKLGERVTILKATAQVSPARWPRNEVRTSHPVHKLCLILERNIDFNWDIICEKLNAQHLA